MFQNAVFVLLIPHITLTVSGSFRVLLAYTRAILRVGVSMSSKMCFSLDPLTKTNLPTKFLSLLYLDRYRLSESFGHALG